MPKDIKKITMKDENPNHQSVIAREPSNEDKTADILLDDADFEFGERVGNMRYAESRTNDLKGTAESTPSIPKDTESCRGEIAFARFVGEPADLGVNTFHDADIAGLQIRSTSHKNGRLLFRCSGDAQDSTEDTFVLVTGSDREWTIVGYMTGSDIVNKYGNKEHWNGRPPVYAVEQKWLNKNWTKLRRQINDYKERQEHIRLINANPIESGQLRGSDGEGLGATV